MHCDEVLVLIKSITRVYLIIIRSVKSDYILSFLDIIIFYFFYYAILVEIQTLVFSVVIINISLSEYLNVI